MTSDFLKHLAAASSAGSTCPSITSNSSCDGRDATTPSRDHQDQGIVTEKLDQLLAGIALVMSELNLAADVVKATTDDSLPDFACPILAGLVPTTCPPAQHIHGSAGVQKFFIGDSTAYTQTDVVDASCGSCQTDLSGDVVDIVMMHQLVQAQQSMQAQNDKLLQMVSTLKDQLPSTIKDEKGKSKTR